MHRQLESTQRVQTSAKNERNSFWTTIHILYVNTVWPNRVILLQFLTSIISLEFFIYIPIVIQ